MGGASGNVQFVGVGADAHAVAAKDAAPIY